MGHKRRLRQYSKSNFRLLWPWPLTSSPTKSTVSCPCSVPWITCANLRHSRFIRFQNIVGNRRTDRRTNERTADRQTGREQYASCQTSHTIDTFKRVVKTYLFHIVHPYFTKAAHLANSGIPCRTACGIRLLAGTVSDNLWRRFCSRRTDAFTAFDDALYKSTFFTYFWLTSDCQCLRFSLFRLLTPWALQTLTF